MGRAATFGISLMTIITAGILIHELTATGLDPMRRAVLEMNSGG